MTRRPIFRHISSFVRSAMSLCNIPRLFASLSEQKTEICILHEDCLGLVLVLLFRGLLSIATAAEKAERRRDQNIILGDSGEQRHYTYGKRNVIIEEHATVSSTEACRKPTTFSWPKSIECSTVHIQRSSRFVHHIVPQCYKSANRSILTIIIDSNSTRLHVKNARM